MLIRLLRTYLRPYRKPLAFLLVLQFAQTMATLYLPTLNADIIDHGVITHDTHYILVTGGWMGVDLETGVPTGKGDWRVAMMPEWTAGQADGAENGGSANSVLSSSKNQLAAAGFLEYMDSGAGAQISASTGDFPAASAILSSSSWQGVTPAYFGGQAINKVLAQASNSVLSGWSYLPFQVYANSVFPNTVGQAYTGKSTIDAGLKAWQQQSASYGTQQGFSVTSK